MGLLEQIKQLGVILALVVSVFVIVQAVSLWAFKWLFDQFVRRIDDRLAAFEKGEIVQTKLIADLEKELLRLRAELPRDYVARADWIRFGAGIDAKLDALRAAFDELKDTAQERARP